MDEERIGMSRLLLFSFFQFRMQSLITNVVHSIHELKHASTPVRNDRDSNESTSL